MTAPALILQGPDAREEFRRWSLAAAIVCAAHVGLMAGYMLMPAAEPEGAMESPAVLKQAPARRWLAAGLLLGLLAAGRWLWTMVAGGHSYDALTWAVWLALLLGPFVLGSYYFLLLLRR